MRSISHNMGVAVIARAAVSGIGFFVVGILTRTLGPEGFGQYSAIFAYLYMFGIAADMGLYTILVRDISRDGADEVSITSRIFTMRLVLAVCIVCAGVGFAFLLPYDRTVQIGIAVAALSTIFSSLVQVLMGVFQKYLKLYLVSIADIAMRLAQLGIVIALFVGGSKNIVLYAGASVIAEAIHLLFIWKFARRIIPLSLRAGTTDHWKSTLRTALPIAASLVFVLLYFKFDTVLLSLMKPAYDVGVYSASYKVLELIIFLPAIYIGLIMPKLSKYAHGDRTQFSSVYQKAFDVLSIFGAPALVYCFVFAEGIVRVVGGSGFPESVLILRILSVAIFLIFFGNLGGNALIALNLQKKGMWIYLGGAIFNIGANLLLIPRYSYIAAAWTTVVTELGVTIAMFAVIYNAVRARPAAAVFAKSFCAALIAGAISAALTRNFLFASALMGIYFPILYALRGFTRDDVRAIVRKSL